MKPRVEIKGDKLLLTDSEGHERHIGELHERTLVTFRDPEKHLMRKWNAYGFNKTVIDSGLIDMVVITFPDKSSAFISVDDIKLEGRVDATMNEEPQYFVDIFKFTTT
jgi:hypothetical protein